MDRRVYHPQKIEPKWQKYWLEQKTFRATIDTAKPKYYVLDMFPYPSGSGLHVGHVAGYTATDILARYKRHRGFNVLHPMGWDSFGLPAEQYAIRTGTHPAETTKNNIDNFRRQLQSLGFSYDWDRELATSDVKYYKWTQWIFTLLHERGLAYEAEMLVNYCPALGTVLANEEVDNGVSKEGGHPVERRPLRQWVLKITEYAERLIDDLDLIDWPESLKRLQINWIGKSEGATTEFIETRTHQAIPIYTTCPHTLFGATYMVLSPEHPLVDTITTAEQKEAVADYKRFAASRSDLERTDLNKEKTGVFTGAYARNPVNDQEIPVWVADYVLMGYGTGAIMAVPAHDERDFEFAQTFGLPIIGVIDPDLSEERPTDVDAEDFRQQVLAGQALWTGGGKCCHSHSTHLSLDGLSVVEGKKAVTEWLEKNGRGKATTNYKLRDWLFSRQRYWGEPFPILHFEDGSHRVLHLDELPLCPPPVDDYKPSGTGESPLAKVRDWVEVTDPVTGKKALRETNTMPQWAGSCWYYLRFCDPSNELEAWSTEAEKYWMPVDMYIGGVEHAVLHLLYARFWHKVLYDCGLVSTLEPFQTLRNQGLINALAFQKPDRAYVDPVDVVKRGKDYLHKESGDKLLHHMAKMSKSKLNGVTPDTIIQELGADALRLYEMFMGPLEKEKLWNTEAVSGCSRFLNRFHDMAFSSKVGQEEHEEGMRLAHRLLHGVCEDIEQLQFNTAIAKMMEFINDFTKLDHYPRRALEMATLALSPFAPHLAEEIWEHLGHQESLASALYPPIDESYLQEDNVTYVVQVNGKLRARFDLPQGQDKDSLFALAEKTPAVAKFLKDCEVRKVIFVPNKLLNIVVQASKTLQS